MQSIFRAFDYAAEKGAPLNQYAVVNLRDAGGSGAAAVFSDIRHRYRDWLYHLRKTGRSNARPMYIYTLENPRDEFAHANWALHLPPELENEFLRKLPQWLARAQGLCAANDCHVQPINPDYAKRLAKYIVKGVDPAYIAHFYLSETATDQGMIYGKRAGVSPSLGPAMRKRENFKPRRRRVWKQAA